MLSHEARVQKIVETFRAMAGKDGWKPTHLPCIGTVYPHVMPLAVTQEFHWCEVWVRVGSPELRYATKEFHGSAEMVAKKLCQLIKAPSKAVGEVAAVLETKKLDGMREPEMAAMFRLDEEQVFKAMALLAGAVLGIVRSLGF